MALDRHRQRFRGSDVDDHLDGVLYIDYLSRLKRDRVIKKFDKAAKRAAG